MNDGRGRRRGVADVLTEEFSGQDQEVVAAAASVARGRAYLAVRIASGEVVLVYLWLDRENRSGCDGPILWRKIMPVGESPRRWPLKVAEALTTWEP